MAFVAEQFFLDMDATTLNGWVDFDQFLDLPPGYDDQSTATTVSPQDLALPFEADGMFPSPSEFLQSSMQSSFEMTNCDLPQEELMGMDGSFMQGPAAPLFDDAAFLGYNPYDSRNSFRNLVEAQAASDPRVATIKEKRREAAIALHLQRLCVATALDLDMSSDSNTSFSSPSWSEYVRGSTSPRPSPENMSVSEAPPPGGIELVLDLNMNAATNVPKKQKPRSQAQKENYIKARKYGACEKHKKQHKRVSSSFTRTFEHTNVRNSATVWRRLLLVPLPMMLRWTPLSKNSRGNRCSKFQFQRHVTWTRQATARHSTHLKRFKHLRRSGNHQAARLGSIHQWDCLSRHQAPNRSSRRTLKIAHRKDATLFNYSLASQMSRARRVKTAFYLPTEKLQRGRLQDMEIFNLARTSQTTHLQDTKNSTHKRVSQRRQEIDSLLFYAVQVHLGRVTQLGCQMAARVCAGALRPRRLMLYLQREPTSRRHPR